MEREVATRSAEETEQLGRELAAELSHSDVVYLVGELGAGKTTLARGLAAGLGAVARQVASPSFALLHEYANPEGEVVLRHLDLYRLEDRTTELAILSLPEEAAGAPIAVEWPRSAIRELLPPTYEIAIREAETGGRRITLRRSKASGG